MSAPESEAAASTPADKPQRKWFRRDHNAPKLSRDEAARQLQVSQSAWSALRDRDAVIAFLNSHDEMLGGRPLDLAVAGAEGLDAVERAIAARAVARG